MRPRDIAAVCAAQTLALAGVEAGRCLAPVLLARLGADSDAALAGWTGASQAVGLGLSLVCVPLWGRLSDRWGRVRMLVRAQAGMALALAAFALARSPLEVLAARALQGVLAGATPAALALVGGGGDGARRMSWVQAAGLSGAVAGPLLAGPLLLWLSPRGAVLTGAAAAALAALITWTINEPASEMAASRAAAGPVAGGSFGQAVSLSFCRSLEDPLLPVIARSLSPVSWEAWLGVLAAASRLSQAAAAPWWGRLCDRRGPEAALRSAALGAGAATAAQALMPSLAALAGRSPAVAASAGVIGMAALAAARVVLGAFAGGLSSALYARTAREAGEAARGEAVAWTSGGLRLGGALAGGAAGAASAALGAPAVLAAAGLGLAALSRTRLIKEETCAAACSTGT